MFAKEIKHVLLNSKYFSAPKMDPPRMYEKYAVAGTLETKKSIGNNKVDWKQNKYNGNIQMIRNKKCSLETINCD